MLVLILLMTLRYVGSLLMILCVLSLKCVSQAGSCPAHTVVVSVFPRHSATVPVPFENLMAGDFRVSANKKVSISNAEYRVGPVRAVILFDVGGNPKIEWKSAVELAADLATALLPRTELDLLTFSDKVEEKFSFHGDRQSFLATVSRLTPVEHPSTERGLLAAISEGLALLSPARPGDVEIFLSSAPAALRKEKQDQQRLEEQLSTSGVRLFGVVFGAKPLVQQPPVQGTFPMVGLGMNPSDVDDHPEFFSSSEILAYQTGGMFLSFIGFTAAKKPSEMKPEAKLLADFVSHFYLLNLQVSDSAKNIEKIKIELRDNKIAKSSLLWYPTRLHPCP